MAVHLAHPPTIAGRGRPGDPEASDSAAGPDRCSPPDAYRRDCPCRDVLDLLANKWTALIVGALDAESLRFGQLRRRLDGISQKMLTQTLRSLERNGLVQRTVMPMPLEVHYALTELGRSVAEPLTVLRIWSEANLGLIESARAAYEARHAAS